VIFLSSAMRAGDTVDRAFAGLILVVLGP